VTTDRNTQGDETAPAPRKGAQDRGRPLTAVGTIGSKDTHTSDYTYKVRVLAAALQERKRVTATRNVDIGPESAAGVSDLQRGAAADRAAAEDDLLRGLTAPDQ
jgi:hypothetical protein